MDSFIYEEEGRYQTIAGLILVVPNRVPERGDYSTSGGRRYAVFDMGGNQIDTVLVIREGS